MDANIKSAEMSELIKILSSSHAKNASASNENRLTMKQILIKETEDISTKWKFYKWKKPITKK